MNNDGLASLPVDTTQSIPRGPSRVRIRTGILTTLIGLLIFSIGAKPDWFHLDRSPVVGFVQIIVFLVGLGIICLGGNIGLTALWKGLHRSIASDIGSRLVSTGYVIALFAGLADVFGMGSQPPPAVPFFGPVQATGVLTGQVLIAVGFLLLIPFGSHETK